MNAKTILNTALELLDEEPDTTTGVCHACGATQEGCEPDAREYECESCGAHRVFGAQETVLMLA